MDLKSKKAKDQKQKAAEQKQRIRNQQDPLKDQNQRIPDQQNSAQEQSKRIPDQKPLSLDEKIIKNQEQIIASQKETIRLNGLYQEAIEKTNELQEELLENARMQIESLQETIRSCTATICLLCEAERRAGALVQKIQHTVDQTPTTDRNSGNQDSIHSLVLGLCREYQEFWSPMDLETTKASALKLYHANNLEEADEDEFEELADSGAISGGNI